MSSESSSLASSFSPATKHAVITIEPLLDEKSSSDKSKKSGKLFTIRPASFSPTGPSAELQRQQRRRLFIHFLGWLLMAVSIIVAALLVYFFIISSGAK